MDRNRESDDALLKRVGLDPIERVMAQKKATWVTHVLRGTEEKVKKSIVRSEISEDRWWKSYVEGIKKVGLTPEMVKQNMMQPVTLKKPIKNNPIRPHSSTVENEQPGESDTPNRPSELRIER